MSSGPEHSPATTPWASKWSRGMSQLAQRVIHWRDWKLPVKLAAVALAPVLFTVIIGTLQIVEHLHHGREYRAMEQVVEATRSVQSAISHLQTERGLAVESLLPGQNDHRQLEAQLTKTDQSIAVVKNQLTAATGRELQFARTEAEQQLAELPKARQAVRSDQADPDAVITTYTRAISYLLALDRAMISQISSSSVVSAATAAHELSKINEEIHLQEALISVGLSQNQFSNEHLALLAGSEARRTTAVQEFRAAASPQQRQEYDQLYADPEFLARETTVQLAMMSGGPGQPATPPVSTQTWKNQSRSTLDELAGIKQQLNTTLEQAATSLKAASVRMAVIHTVLLLAALLTAAALVAVVCRQLVQSLATLQRSALDAAQRQLPKAVEQIRNGNSQRISVDRVPVDTRDEIGDVARAFDAVNTQALNLATEQAQLRRTYHDSFINISRRSQSLLERQLQLFEQLERDEEDPEQLATLFRLDHLSTRMRRNNENLMVISGAEISRRLTQSTSPADLVRAAISEIEHYPRVIVQPLPNTKVVSYVANDMVRLLAELIDNAANFSSPDTEVTVTGHRNDDNDLVLTITDRGIGMSPEQLAAVNERLTADGELDSATSRRMGLFVVSRLANRHGIKVRLHPGPQNIGVRTTVTVDSSLLADAEVPTVHHLAAQTVASDGAAYEQARFGWEAPEDIPKPRNGFQLGKQPEAAAAEPRNGHQVTNGASLDQQGAPEAEPTGGTDLSAWFVTEQETNPAQAQIAVRCPSTPPEDSPEGTATPGDGSSSAETPDDPAWDFATDQAQRKVDELAAQQPAKFTQAGLPLRTPQRNLLPAMPEENSHGAPDHTVRNARASSSRLASFRQGVRRGRHESKLSQNGQGEQNGSPTQGKDEPAASEHTAAGLPRRTPRTPEHQPEPKGNAAVPPRDADEVRGRMTGLQRGLRDSKHSSSHK